MKYIVQKRKSYVLYITYITKNNIGGLEPGREQTHYTCLEVCATGLRLCPFEGENVGTDLGQSQQAEPIMDTELR